MRRSPAEHLDAAHELYADRKRLPQAKPDANTVRHRKQTEIKGENMGRTLTNVADDGVAQSSECLGTT